MLTGIKILVHNYNRRRFCKALDKADWRTARLKNSEDAVARLRSGISDESMIAATNEGYTKLLQGVPANNMKLRDE